MKPERWQQIDRLLKAALKVEASQRATFLDEACTGDEKMRREVDSLLAATEQTGSSIEAPAFDTAVEVATEGRSESLVGRRLGHYKIAGEIGHGGMGVVYLAQDTSLRRRVALKLALPAGARPGCLNPRSIVGSHRCRP